MVCSLSRHGECMTLHMTHMTHLQFKCNVWNRFLLAEFSLGPGAGRRQHTALGGRACSVEQTMALLGIFQMRCSWIWNVCIIPHSLPQNGSEPGIARVCSDQVWQGGPPSQGERCAGIFTACWRLNLRSAALGWMANSGEKLHRLGEMYGFLNTFSIKVGGGGGA